MQLLLLSRNYYAVGLQENVTVTMATSAQRRGRGDSEVLAFHIHSAVTYKWEVKWDAGISDCLQVFDGYWSAGALRRRSVRRACEGRVRLEEEKEKHSADILC